MVEGGFKELCVHVHDVGPGYACVLQRPCTSHELSWVSNPESTYNGSLSASYPQSLNIQDQDAEEVR